MFSSIIGHETLKPRLSSLISQPGSYLFYGPMSVGKRSAAFELSKYILCKDQKEDGCTCNSCKCFQNHPDFLCVGQEGRIKVEDAEKVNDFAGYSPLISNTRVIVIDDVDRATSEAANRLLKTIEDSSYTFFLITSDLSSVLPTLKSRCVQIKFGTLSQDDITNILWKKHGFELTKARVIGWIGQGTSSNIFTDAGLYLKHRDKAHEFLGNFGLDLLSSLDYVDGVEKKELSIFIDMLILILTDILNLKIGIEDIVNADLRDSLKKIGDKFSEKGMILVLSYLTQVKKYSRLNINLALHLKNSLMKSHPAIRV